VTTQPTIEERVTRLEQLAEKLIAYGRSTAMGRALLARLGLPDA
jgi:hypothetical protein